MSRQDDNTNLGRRKLLGSTVSVAAAAGFAGAGAAPLVAPAQAQQRQQPQGRPPAARPQPNRTEGFNSVVVVDPGEDLAVFVATNRAGVGVPRLGIELASQIR